MASSGGNSRTVRPGILLLCMVALLAVVIVGEYRITHPRSTNTDSQLTNQPQSTTYVAPTTTPTSPPPTTTRPRSAPSTGTVSINRVVVANGIRVDVISMQCGLTKVGQGYATLAADPGSQYCLVRVNVKNVSSSPNTWSSGGETAYDARGNTFSSESEAELYVSNSNLMDPMNPGVTAPDIVPFELPVNDRLVRMSLYSGFSESAISVPLT
jgi:hypothetical protein